MIITHTTNGQGHARVYLGAKSSLECWIEPAADGIAWTLHLGESFCGVRINEADKRTWAAHTLMKLAHALNVAPNDLAAVPFEAIASLHMSDPFLHARRPASRRPDKEFAFVATVPNTTRPAEYKSASAHSRHRH